MNNTRTRRQPLTDLMGARPANYKHPTITLERAVADGMDPVSLHNAADWNFYNARGATKQRRLRQSRELRAVAFALRAYVVPVELELAA